MENVFLGWTINLLGEKIVGKENKAPFLLLELGSLLVQTGVIAPSLKRLPKTTWRMFSAKGGGGVARGGTPHSAKPFWAQ